VFSVLSSDPVSSDRVLVLGEGVSRRTGSSTRPGRAFSWRVETRTRSRRGLSNFAQTRAHTRRVVLCPQSNSFDTRLREMGWGGPSSNEGTYTVVV
jgi:hypothetical protein